MKKKLFSTLFAILLLCSSGMQVMAADDVLSEINVDVDLQPGMRIAVVSKSKKGEYWSMVRKGMNLGLDAINEIYNLKKSDKITMTFEGLSDEQQVNEQINILDAVIAENPDVLCVSVSDMESCQPQLEAAVENGIPVVVFDSNLVDSSLVTTFCATDNEKVGKMAAEALADAMEESGKVVVFSAQEKTESVQNRMLGFREAISDYEEIEIIEVLYSDGVEDMKNAMIETLSEYENIEGVFCTNADISELYLGLDASLRENKKLVGVDATTKQQNAIKAGEEVSCISQDPVTLGYETIISAAYAAMWEEGKYTKDVILLKPQVIDLNTIYNPAYTNYLYKELQ